MYYKEMILFYLKEVKSRKRYITEYDGESKLPNEKLDQLLKDNPLEGVFDFEEHPEVKFRSYLEYNGKGLVRFA